MTEYNMTDMELEEIYEEIVFDEMITEGMASDIGHVVLDVTGVIADFAGGQGVWFDAANAVWYMAEKKPLYAALSLISMIPIIGDIVGKGGKYIHKLEKGRRAGATMYKAGKVMKSAKTVDRLAKLKKTLENKEVQKATKKAFDLARKNEKLAPHIDEMESALKHFSNEPVHTV